MRLHLFVCLLQKIGVMRVSTDPAAVDDERQVKRFFPPKPTRSTKILSSFLPSHHRHRASPISLTFPTSNTHLSQRCQITLKRKTIADITLLAQNQHKRVRLLSSQQIEKRFSFLIPHLRSTACQHRSSSLFDSDIPSQ